MTELADFEVGKKFNAEYGPVTRDMIQEYGNASGDKNPIHMDEDFATNVGKLNGVIAHGMLSYGVMINWLDEMIGPKGKIMKISGEMRGMVRPGDMYQFSAEVKSIDGNTVEFELVETSKTKIKIEKDGATVEEFEAAERGWISEKDKKRGYLKTEEVPEGTLHYRERLSIPATATVVFEE